MAKIRVNSLKRMARELVKEYGKDDIYFIAQQLYNASLSGPDFKSCIKIVRSIL